MNGDILARLHLQRPPPPPPPSGETGSKKTEDAMEQEDTPSLLQQSINNSKE